MGTVTIKTFRVLPAGVPGFRVQRVWGSEVQVVDNSLFLTHPWVRGNYLDSRILSSAARRLPGPWQKRYHDRPFLNWGLRIEAPFRDDNILRSHIP